MAESYGYGGGGGSRKKRRKPIYPTPPAGYGFGGAAAGPATGAYYNPFAGAPAYGSSYAGPPVSMYGYAPPAVGGYGGAPLTYGYTPPMYNYEGYVPSTYTTMQPFRAQAQQGQGGGDGGGEAGGEREGAYDWFYDRGAWRRYGLSDLNYDRLQESGDPGAYNRYGQPLGTAAPVGTTMQRQSGKYYKNPFTEQNMRRMNYTYHKPGISIQELRETRKKLRGTYSGEVKGEGGKKQKSKSGPVWYNDLINWDI